MIRRGDQHRSRYPDMPDSAWRLITEANVDRWEAWELTRVFGDDWRAINRFIRDHRETFEGNDGRQRSWYVPDPDALQRVVDSR